MKRRSWDELAAYRARVRGCLLGGAVGDMMGRPLELLSWDAIRAGYGAAGVTGPVPDEEGVIGRIGDRTQLTVFTVEGCLRAHARAGEGDAGEVVPTLVREAYLRWWDTQTRASQKAPAARNRTDRQRRETWLYARRDPGAACPSGLRETCVPDLRRPLDGSAGPVNPGSKGCGAVVRSAPFGLMADSARTAFELAAHCAQITHGHPTGYYSAGALAAVISHLVDGDAPAGAALRTVELLTRYPGHEETTTALRRAVDLASDGEATPEKLETLGTGRSAEEALAIGLYAVLAHTRPQAFCVGSRGVTCDPEPPRTPIEAAFLLSVNHSGASGSTGSVCGSLLGARHGDIRLPQHWLVRAEGRATIAAVADDLAAEVRPGEERPWAS